MLQDDAQAIQWFRKAAEQDHASAQTSLGLDGIAAKIHRADEHIGHLKTEIANFLRDNYRIGCHVDAESRQYRFSAFGDAAVPLRLAIIIGETVHQLRSVLDHVITQ